MTPIDANANQGTPQQGQSTAAPTGPMKRGPKRAGDSAKRGKWLRHSSREARSRPAAITRLDHSEKRERFAEKIELTRKIVTD